MAKPAEQNKVVRLMQNQFHALSTLVDRYNILRRLGKSYSNDRDTYAALGYIVQPSYEDYDARFERGDIAGTIIEEPCRATWQEHPAIE